MNAIYFTTVEVMGKNENNRSFYLAPDEAKKDTEARIQEEIRNVQKLIHDYGLETPILSDVLKNLAIDVIVRPFVYQEEKAS